MTSFDSSLVGGTGLPSGPVQEVPASSVFGACARQPVQPSANFSIEMITPDNVQELHPLMDSQAEAHSTFIKGDRGEFEKTILLSGPKDRILDGFILRAMDGRAAGFVTVSLSHTSEGRVLYLEDIHSLPAFQGQGLGHFMYKAVEYLAMRFGGHAVPCTVDESLTDTHAFYKRQGAVRHEVPVLGMDDFVLLQAPQGAPHVYVMHRDHEGERDRILGMSQQEIDAQDLQALQLTDCRLYDESSFRKIEPAHIDTLPYQLQNTGLWPCVGSHSIRPDDLIDSIYDATVNSRNFCVARFNETSGRIEDISFDKDSFSTFNNHARLNVGSIVSLQGETPSQSAILSHVAFSSSLNTNGGRIELQLDPVAAEGDELARLFDMCKSRMTENDTDELTFSKRIDPAECQKWFNDLPPWQKGQIEALIAHNQIWTPEPARYPDSSAPALASEMA